MVISFEDWSIRDFSYILALAEHKHFGRAAEACSVSQPALSKQLKQFEKRLGTPLFERTKRQVILTEFGQLFVEQLRMMMDELDKLSSLQQVYQAPLTGTFRLGAIATCGPYLIPHFLASLKERFPQLSLIVREGHTQVLLSELRQGKLDAVIAAEPIDREQFRVFPLFYEPFLLAVSNLSPLSRQKSVHPETVRSEQLLLLEDGNCLKDQTLSFCPQVNQEKAFPFQASSIETLTHMVSGGEGCSVIPVLAQSKDPKLRALISYLPFTQSIGRSMVLVTRKNHPQGKNMPLLATCIQDSLPPEVSPLT